MCGIVGAVAQSNIVPFLLQGLRRLEYRGYDSSGIAVIDSSNELARARRIGRVGELEEALSREPLAGTTGIAHTRWATHGPVTEKNAHPHICWNKVAVVCNGIIENFEELKQKQLESGFEFTSDTDTESSGPPDLPVSGSGREPGRGGTQDHAAAQGGLCPGGGQH